MSPLCRHQVPIPKCPLCFPAMTPESTKGKTVGEVLAAQRAVRQMLPIAEAIAADPVKVKDRLFWWSAGCWAIGFVMGTVVLGLVWAVVA